MKQSGHHRIHAPKSRVWEALNDTRLLARCIEGCESFKRLDEQSFRARVRAHIGPVDAVFIANLTLIEEPDSNSPESAPPDNNPDVQTFRVLAELERATAGFGRGEARVTLREESKGITLLDYEIQAVVAGKLAQLGARLVESAASSMAASFFGRLERELGGKPASTSSDSAQGRAALRTSWLVWTAAAAAGALALVWVFVSILPN